MLLRVLAHVKPHKRNSQLRSQGFGQLSLPHTGGSHKKKGGHRLVLFVQTRLGELHRIAHLTDSLILTENLFPQLFFQILKPFQLPFLHGSHGNVAGLGQDLIQKSLVDRLPLLVQGMEPAPRPCLVDQVDGLVGKKTLVNISAADIHRMFQDSRTIFHAVESLVSLFQAF